MTNLTLFVNGFLEYLIVFLVFGASIVVAMLIGFNARKIKNKSDENKTQDEAAKE